MTDGQTANRIQILRNDLFGEIEIIQTRTQTFIAKRLTQRSAAIFERAHKAFPFLFSNEFPFLQEFHAQTEIFGATYLLFKYYDYSLQNMLDSNKRAALQLPENMVIKLINDLFFCITYLKNKGLIYPVIHNKTIFVSKTGNLKLTNPLLYEEAFVNLMGPADEGQALLESDRRFGDVGRVALEQATLTDLFTSEATPADFENAQRLVRQKYSCELYNFIRKFDFFTMSRVPSESRFQNYNAAENYYNLNAKSVDKYLGGMKLAAMDFEVPRFSEAQAYTVKNGSVYRIGDRRSGLVESERQSQQVFGVDLNQSDRIGSLRPESIRQEIFRPDSIRPDSLRPDSLRQDSVRLESLKQDTGRIESVKVGSMVYQENLTSSRNNGASADIPPTIGSNLLGPFENRVNIVSLPNIQHTQTSSAYLSNKKQPLSIFGAPPVVINTQGSLPSNDMLTSNHNFVKKKTEDSFFDDVFEKPVSQELPAAGGYVSDFSQRGQSIQSRGSLAADNFFEVPQTYQQPIYQSNTNNPFKSDQNVSASFRNNVFNTSVRDSGASDNRRSKSTNLVEPPVNVNTVPQKEFVKYAMASPVYVDPNESFSKRLAQAYQKEYKERNDSLRDSNGSYLAQPQARLSDEMHRMSNQPQVLPIDKQYAVIHDFPVRN